MQNANLFFTLKPVGIPLFSGRMLQYGETPWRGLALRHDRDAIQEPGPMHSESTCSLPPEGFSSVLNAA
jgi:hypothetical protein